MKIVKNYCYGGFSVTQEVGKRLKALGLKIVLNGEKYEKGTINNLEDIYLDNETFGITSNNYKAYRSDKRLIKILEDIGIDNCNGTHSELVIIEIPDDVNWEIDDYDGIETIHEIHRTW